MNRHERLKVIPKKLPMIFLSGGNDPVGRFGKDVMKVYDMYKELGIENISVKLYNGDRHEILNEIGREQVYEDVIMWLDSLLEDELI